MEPWTLLETKRKARRREGISMLIMFLKKCTWHLLQKVNRTLQKHGLINPLNSPISPTVEKRKLEEWAV